MRNKTRATAGIAAAGGMLLLAACGSGGGDGGEAPPPGEASGKVTFWTYPFGVVNEASWWQEHVDEFNKEYPDVEVEVVMQAFSGREEALITAITGGNPPDVVYFNPDFIPKYADQDLLLPLDDMRKDWDAFEDSALEAMSWDDELYGAPMLMQLSTSFCNTDVLAAAGGVECPTTWDEFREVAPAIKEAGYYPGSYSGTSTLNHTFYMYLWQAGGEVLNDDMTKATFNGPEGLEALEFIKEMADEEWIPKEPISVSSPFEQTEIAQGQVGYVLGGQLVQTREALDPAVIETVPPMKNEEQVASGSVGAWSIFNTTESPEAAKAWVSYLTDKPFLKSFLSESGYLSPRSDIEGLFADDPQTAEGAEYLDVMRSGVQHPKAREIIDTIAPHIQSVLLQGADPQQELDDAAKAVDALL